MTFIDGETQPPTIIQIILYSTVAASFAVCGLWVFYRSHTRRHYARVYVVRFLFPIACLFCCTENIYLSVSGYFIRYALDPLNQESHPMLQALFVLQAMQVPIFLVTIFELTYLIHKRRSVHFLGMYFDEGRLGRRVKGVFSTPCKSFLARNFIRMLSTLLFVTGVIVNFDVLRRLNTVSDLTGKTGWWQLFDKEAPLQPDVVMSLVPIIILVVCSFVLSTTLWRYGTSTSMIVYSSFLNPWFGPFFGTLILVVGHVVTGRWFAITSNISLLIYTITLILLMRQIDRDIVAFAEFTDFLRQVAKKGNEITVHNVLQGMDSNINIDTNSAAGAAVGVELDIRIASHGLSLPDLNEENGQGGVV